MITLIGKEGCNAGSGTRSIVISDSANGGVRTNYLVVVAIDSEVLFQSLIISFSLSITFRVISGSEVKLHVQRSSEGPEEVRYKFRAAIGSDVARDTVLGKDV